MARTAVLGFSRIGAERELKFALEDHWAGEPRLRLKTRGWDETRAALSNLVAAAQRRRAAVPA